MAYNTCLVFLGSLFFGSPSDSLPDRVEREAWVMGTRLHLLAESSSPESALAVSETVIRELERMDRALSSWDPASAIGTINSAPPGQPTAVPAEVLALLSEVEALETRVVGTFNPRMGALVDVWDLRGRGKVPEEWDREEAVLATGRRSFRTDPEAMTVERRHERAWLDTDGFGKGAALRSAARALNVARDVRAVVDLGGQILAIGPSDSPWTIRVAHPSRRDEAALELRVSGVSVATSGNSERQVLVHGQPIGHLLDPRTGSPAPIWGSVTVVSRDPLEADVLATALYVMGPRDGLEWSRTLDDVGVLFLEEVGDTLRPSWNGAMERWLSTEPFFSSAFLEEGTEKEKEYNVG